MNNLLLNFRKLAKHLLRSKQKNRHALVGAPNVWEQARDFQFQFLLNRGLKKSDRLLDIGCGTLRGGIPLIDFLDSGNYYGIDVRKEVLDEGRKEIKAAKLQDKAPNLICFRNFFDVKLNECFNVIFAFSVLIHFEDKIADECLHFVSSFLKKDGVFYANVNIANQSDGKWLEFPIVFRSFEFYEKLASKNGLEVEVLGNLLSLGHNTGKKSDRQQVMLVFKKKKAVE